MFSDEATHLGVVFRVEVVPGIPETLWGGGGAERLKRVLTCLLFNAVEPGGMTPKADHTSLKSTVHQHITTHTERGREKRGRGGISIGSMLDCELLLEYTSHILSRETVAQASQAQRAMFKAEIALI